MAQTRFDYLVRNDFFAGLAGNQEAFKRAMDTTERVLAENPNHPEALVWHGMGVLMVAGQEFQKGKGQEANALLQKGIAETDRAVELAPDSIGVRIPRGAGLTQATRGMREPMGSALLEKARTDFQHAYDVQQNRLEKMGTHPLGELLQNLGDIYSRQGKPAEAEKYYGRMQSMLKDTVYAKRAAQWMETRQPLPAAQTTCVGCHTGNQ